MGSTYLLWILAILTVGLLGEMALLVVYFARGIRILGQIASRLEALPDRK